MKYLIAGLGNIGAEYHNTRHNIGFMVLDFLSKQQEVEFTLDRLAEKSEFKFKGRSVHLIKPTTYMNLSGKAVRYWLNQLEIKPENLLVITDDLALPAAKLRLRTKGSAGGHNGLADIETQLQTVNYPRLRFGIGNNFPKGKQADYVLSGFTEKEMELIQPSIEKAAQTILSFTTQSIELTMSFCNKD